MDARGKFSEAVAIRLSAPHNEMVSANDIVVQTEHLSAAAAEWLSKRCRLIRCGVDDARFAHTIKDASGLLVRTYTLVDDAMLIGAPRLRVVGRAGVGLDNIDVQACRRRGIEVVYTPDANTQAVVEYVLCLLCDALRPRITLDRALPTSEWNHLREVTVGSRQMNQLTLGVLGFGRVGRRVAQVATAIGYRVLFNDLLDIPESQHSDANVVDAEELFAQSDIVSIHIDGRASNRHFVGGRLIKSMRSNAILINASRGFVVDNFALREFLVENRNALALLDVHDPEPFGSDYPLLEVPNARLYPHLASRTEAAMSNMSWVVRDMVAVLEGRRPSFAAP